MKIRTTYVINAKKKYSGVAYVEETIWDYATAEFSNKLQVGIAEDPVLESVIEIKKLPISIKNDEISYWTVFPSEEEHQRKYLGMYQDALGEWVDVEEEN